eukprot:TRINITY_DN3478_c1_g1_i2.p1 TRINITY_DN3478_c1_g1~~TRINITY_DN3478_c1_g1_i2.p1  ORF type:complete len:350 (+),score=57.74 TRINITY_DN3478_c1_g1_i2:501-1550(+)
MSAEDKVTKLPDLDISHNRFILTLSYASPTLKEKARSSLETSIKENNMVKYYQEVCEQFKWNPDTHFISEATKKNEQTLKELDDKIEDAVKNLGETEVRDCHYAKAEYLLKIGDRAASESVFRITYDKTVGAGQRLDLVFILIRIGFFYDDKDMIRRNIQKAKSMIEEGGDWDRRNRLKVYEAYYLMSIRQFSAAANLFLDTLATFNSEELFTYEKNVLYTTLTALVSLDRVPLKQKVIDSPEVLTVINQIPDLQDLLNSFYDADYKTFFCSLASITESMKYSESLYQHVSFYAREMRIRAYKQYLQSYRSVQLKSIAQAFGVSVSYMDKYDCCCCCCYFGLDTNSSWN